VTKPDDCTVSPGTRRRIRKEAGRVLAEAAVTDALPTPVEDIVAVAGVRVAQIPEAAGEWLAQQRQGFGSSLKKALGKVLGVLDTGARLVYLDRCLFPTRKTFVELHEVGHAFLPWQQSLYAGIEDSDKELASEWADSFDREANVFAADVLFQLDRFTEEAADYPFGFATPLELSKRYGASVYSSIRRYVAGNCVPCAVLVLDLPKPSKVSGLAASLRRYIPSAPFQRIYGDIQWPSEFTVADPIGALIPLNGHRMTAKRETLLSDRDGNKRVCSAEGFTQTYQVFVLLRDMGAMPHFHM